MSSLAELRATIAGAVNGIGSPPLIGYDYPPDNPTPPCAIVEPDEVDFEGEPATFQRGNEEWTFALIVLVSPAHAESAARLTDAFFDRSANDIKDAIETADSALKVSGADRWGEFTVAGREFAGLRFTVKANN